MSNDKRNAEHLLVDPPVVIDCKKPTMTQNYFVASFISPEDRIKQRFIYEANRFLYHDINKQIIDTTSNLTKTLNSEFNKLLEVKINSYKSSNDPIYKAVAEVLDTSRQELQLNEDEQINKTLRTYKIDQEELIDRFETYKIQNNKELEAEFNNKYTEETSVRGFKVRGVYEDLTDAKARANHLQKNVESFVHTFVGPVGYWVPFDPNADAVQDQEYMIPELNNLMSQKKRNSEQKDEFFAKRKQMMTDNAQQSQEKLLREKLENRIKEQQNQRKKK